MNKRIFTQKTQQRKRVRPNTETAPTEQPVRVIIIHDKPHRKAPQQKQPQPKSYDDIVNDLIFGEGF